MITTPASPIIQTVAPGLTGGGVSGGGGEGREDGEVILVS